MSHIFEKASIAGINLKNRIIRSATHEGLGDEDGYPRKELSDIYQKLAQNNVGAILTGFTCIQQDGKTLKNMRMLDNDKYIDDYKALNLKMKEYDTPMILQLAHGGGMCSPKISGKIAVAPSSIKLRDYPTKPRELSEQEIEQIINNFVKAIERAQKAGFDGVQLHAAHGYLLSQFISPHFNKRKDNWGGSTENRVRIVTRIIKEAKQSIGDYPVLVKMSSYDNCKDGIKLKEGIKIAQMLQQAGCDAIELSCGGGDGFNSVRVPKLPMDAVFKLVPKYKKMHPLKKKLLTLISPLIFKTYKPLHNYNVEAARQIKEHVDLPLIVVGGIRRIEDIKNVIDNNIADYVSMSRPFIIEPGIVTKFINGKQDTSRCIDCGYCLIGITANPLKCYYGKLPK
ncbi:MAG: NADH:flavin oxidoreductase [Desulfobacteraceae bacterium]|nr:NADH:flavin oxidoreductase [Desulfobacteraceae bacterium]